MQLLPYQRHLLLGPSSEMGLCPNFPASCCSWLAPGSWGRAALTPAKQLSSPSAGVRCHGWTRQQRGILARLHIGPSTTTQCRAIPPLGIYGKQSPLDPEVHQHCTSSCLPLQACVCLSACRDASRLATLNQGRLKILSRLPWGANTHMVYKINPVVSGRKPWGYEHGALPGSFQVLCNRTALLFFYRPKMS